MRRGCTCACGELPNPPVLIPSAFAAAPPTSKWEGAVYYPVVRDKSLGLIAGTRAVSNTPTPEALDLCTIRKAKYWMERRENKEILKM